MKDVLLMLDASGKIVGTFTRPAKPTAHTEQPLSPRRLAMWEKQGGLCHLCGKPMRKIVSRAGDSVTEDHLIPKSEGGTRARSNIKLAHRRCNNQRGNRRLPDEDASTEPTHPSPASASRSASPA